MATLTLFLFIIMISVANGFRPISCRLHPDNMLVYAMSIHFKFEAVKEIDTIILQCSRLLSGRDFSSFNTQLFPLQDVEVMRTNAQGISELVISSLLKGTLYHCRCMSNNLAYQYQFESPILSTSTKRDFSIAPRLQSMVELIKSDNEKSIKLRWNPLAQDVTTLTIQISNKIRPIWADHEIHVDGDVAGLYEYDIGITDFNDGEAYSLKMMFSNENGIGYSNVLSFVVPFVYLEDIDVRAPANIEMSELTPAFNRKIFSYAIMVSQRCETIEFGITPLDNIQAIYADTISNGSAVVNKVSDEDNEELIEEEESSNKIDLTTPNENLMKSNEQIEEETDAIIDSENTEIESEELDTRLGMDTLLNAETQSFDLDPPGTATKFTIHSGSNIKYEIRVIRSKDVFGVPKYQIFQPPEPEPCPKQKRIIIRYGSFLVYYKEYIVGFLVFIFMVFVRIYERSTRIKVNELFLDALVPEEK